MRVKRGTTRRKKHKKVLKKVKGYKGRKKSVFKLAKEANIKAGKHAYKHRKVKKRDFRRLWITKINAAARMHGIKYSEFINLLDENDIDLNRKMLADMAEHNPEAFAAIVDKVK